MAETWSLVTSEGRTVYHSSADHPSGLRLAVKADGVQWAWSVYDRRYPTASARDLQVGAGKCGSWRRARIRAAQYAASFKQPAA